MTNIKEINQIIKNINEELKIIKVIINLLKNEVESADYKLYELEERIKKETTAQ